MRKRAELAVMLLLLAGLLLAGRYLSRQVASDKVEVKKNLVVVDCGHGGADPGKVGAGDVLEKDLNLQIGKRVEKKLKKKGYEVVMTRTEDKDLAEGGDNWKVRDMKNRVALVNGSRPGLAVSIHQNSYNDAAVHGSQVFYYTHSTEGKEAAAIMQEALLLADPDNMRQEKANDTYYFLKRTEVPTIIVECGFLSNPEEAARLSEKDYQEKIADAIVSGVEKYLESQR